MKATKSQCARPLPCAGVILVLLWLLAPLSAYAEPILQIRVDQGAYPATYKKDKQWLGMDIELLEEFLKRAELNYLFTEIPFQRSLLMMREGKVHIVPNLVKNDERAEYMHWLGPTRTTCIGLVVQAQHKDLALLSTDELIDYAVNNDKKIGYLNGASYSEYFDHRLKTDTKLNDVLLFLPSNNQHREMLIRGRIFGYFYDAFEIQSRMSDPRFASLYEGLVLNAYRIEESCTGAYIGVSRQLSEIGRAHV